MLFLKFTMSVAFLWFIVCFGSKGGGQALPVTTRPMPGVAMIYAARGISDILPVVLKILLLLSISKIYHTILFYG